MWCSLGLLEVRPQCVPQGQGCPVLFNIFTDNLGDVAGYPHHVCWCHQPGMNGWNTSGTSTGTSWTSAKGSAKPCTRFFVARKRTLSSLRAFLSEALQLSYSCRGIGEISVPSHCSWRWQLSLPTAALAAHCAVISPGLHTAIMTHAEG